MKPTNLPMACLRASWAAVNAWGLYWSQIKHNPAMAAKARAIAEQRRADADLYEALDRVFPLGYAWRFKS